MPGCIAGLLDLKASLDRWRAPGAGGGRRAARRARGAGPGAGGRARSGGGGAAVERASARPRSAGWREARAGARIHADPARPACRRRAVGRAARRARAGASLDARRRSLEPGRRRAGARTTAAGPTGSPAQIEIPAILHALDGRLSAPGAGRRPAAQRRRAADRAQPARLRSVPHPERLRGAGRRAAGASGCSARHVADGNGLPETVAMVLWGTDNLKTEGGPIAQALCAAGRRAALRQLRPAVRRASWCRSTGSAARASTWSSRCPASSATCCRCRPSCWPRRRLLAAAADEPAAENFVRKHALAYQAAHGGGIAQAALRVFGNADGAYGANVNQLVDDGGLERRGRTRRNLCAPQGIRLRRRRARRRGRTRC